MTGNAKFVKLQPNEDTERDQPLQKASVYLDDVTLCISKVHIYAHIWFCCITPEKMTYLSWIIVGYILCCRMVTVMF